MNTQHERLGRCTRCGTELQDRHVVIEYETANGRGIWARCPSCREIVDPR